MKFWDRAIEYAIYLGLVMAMIAAVGMVLGNVDVLLREVVDNLLTTALWVARR